MMVTIPRPPICIIIKIMICPNTLHVLNVGRVTSPVTHTDVVAVKRASIYGTGFPLAELIGSESNILPVSTAIRKLNMMICVVEISHFNFFKSIRLPCVLFIYCNIYFRLFQ